ncbi:hypothetical protein KL912_005214 [Ogataea haglerorum]|nr:hypothetical protein KL912_005214 [Ogataea haglerorum]
MSCRQQLGSHSYGVDSSERQVHIARNAGACDIHVLTCIATLGWNTTAVSGITKPRVTHLMLMVTFRVSSIMSPDFRRKTVIS